MVTQLNALMANKTVRILDLVILTRAADGSIDAAELRDVEDSDVGELRGLERDLAVLLAEEDVEEIGQTLDPASVAAVLVYENSWAAPFTSAIRRAGRCAGRGRPDPDPGADRRGAGSVKPRETEREMGLFSRARRATRSDRRPGSPATPGPPR
jgi:hypothetical protein